MSEQNVNDAIDMAYDALEGCEDLLYYHARHGTPSLLILTQCSPKVAIETAAKLGDWIDGKDIIEIGAGVGFLRDYIFHKPILFQGQKAQFFMKGNYTQSYSKKPHKSFGFIKLWFRRLVSRPAGILSNLALHLKKGYAGVSHVVEPKPVNQREAASYYLGQSARHFREFYRTLFGAFRVAARRPKTRANAVPVLVKSVAGCKHPAWPQSPAQTSRFGKDSCPPENAKSTLLSNAEKLKERGGGK